MAEPNILVPMMAKEQAHIPSSWNLKKRSEESHELIVIEEMFSHVYRDLFCIRRYVYDLRSSSGGNYPRTLLLFYSNGSHVTSSTKVSSSS
ncbi:hypothetical protein AbraIFM66951_002302 [Aspergillus brasiliensis]|uniref:Uncharacterized protein n=1 Tax=Aspergillus brasiliensis TaxID=319629 RepID=A0A9W5YUW6_9EURO|nr:hypothetical protein AbraCBS73388_011043 [Aspergillus brasiliensis]GKZ42611.1 hypothetical protein AbraIFM66951_002302 [Aspergillus brasiliensis]